MKTIIVVIVLCGAALAGLYYFGGFSSFDPNQQGREAKAAITPGMTYQQVLSAAGDHPKYRSITLKTEKRGGQTLSELQEGPPVDFDRKRVDGRVAKNEVPHGFIFHYVFSDSLAFDVVFDATGKVAEVRDAPTMATLLKYDQDAPR
ncbi:MAG: hypothetical protein AMXMBFR13_25850 [Phycisphaerae bacterium]